MKGQNELRLNKETVLEAIEEYVNKRAVGSGIIEATAITFINGNSAPFVVTITEPPKELDKAKSKP